MFTIISLLIWKTSTLDGNAGSAVRLTDMMTSTMKQQIYSCVLMKYKIMKIRMKISFSAFEKQITIKELFYR
tara:strand:- start:17 stop:232 length:216 start_codon:yes stop_codon:yes gene_type:complete